MKLWEEIKREAEFVQAVVMLPYVLIIIVHDAARSLLIDFVTNSRRTKR